MKKIYYLQYLLPLLFSFVLSYFARAFDTARPKTARPNTKARQAQPHKAQPVREFLDFSPADPR